MSPDAPPPGGMGAAPSSGGPVGYYAPPATSASRPAVILWYRVFAIVSALVYGLFVYIWFIASTGTPDGASILSGAICVLPLVAFYAVAALVPFKPWGWTYGLVAIAFGMLSCLAPLSVLLVILWARPQVKAAFQRI